MAAVNDGYLTNPWLLAESEGYQYDRAAGTLSRIADPNPDPALRNPRGVFDRTGGLIRRRVVMLTDGDRLYRFAAKRFVATGAQPLLPLLNSPWWIERERLYLLGYRAREASRRLAEMARDQLALPTDWTDCDCIVAVTPKPGLQIAAIAGPGITAQGGTERRVVAHEAPHLHIEQLYIPGLGRHTALGKPWGTTGEASAAAWFDLSTAQLFDPPDRAVNG
jgi:hypothetical protein